MICLILAMQCFLTGCGASLFSFRGAESTEDWGSFTDDKTYSYDGAFYAVQKVERGEDGLNGVMVRVYRADGSLVDSFCPARASDFWGICWEEDTYNIWTQSGDTGLAC